MTPRQYSSLLPDGRGAPQWLLILLVLFMILTHADFCDRVRLLRRHEALDKRRASL